MKASITTFALLFLATAVATAQQSSPTPTLSMAKRSAAGKAIEIQKHVPQFKPETYTVQVPELITEEVEGQTRSKTVYKTAQQTRMVCITAIVCVASTPDSIEVRTLEGRKYKSEDIPALFTDDFTPVIVVERQKTVVDGKESLQPVKFDKAYLKLFKPDTLIVFLPPTSAAQVPPGIAPPTVSPVPAPVPAPTTVPAPVPSVPMLAE